LSKEQLDRLTLLRDSGWRAALTIFCSPLLGDRGEVWNSIDLESRTIHIENMLDACGAMSGGEQRLVKLALSLFNQQIEVNLWKTLAGLDEANGQVAVDAVAAFNGGPLRQADAIRKVLLTRPIRKREGRS